jgi:hypothetical protein
MVAALWNIHRRIPNRKHRKQLVQLQQSHAFLNLGLPNGSNYRCYGDANDNDFGAPASPRQRCGALGQRDAKSQLSIV